MNLRVPHIGPWFRRFAALGLLGVGGAVLTGCDRHGEDEVRAALERWFYLGDATYFASNSACTAAMYKAQSFDVKSSLRTENSVEAAIYGYKQSGTFALQRAGITPDQAFLDAMNADRPLGVLIQAAGLEGKNCMDETITSAFHYALSNPEGVIVFDKDLGALIMLDPRTRLVIFASGGA
ncbi:hypothetical protein A9Q95_10285 [Rhodobacterales bacterium 59_46_T64]|nr:hypothetical protein A9Q95_10285 [Rhodobacterales bacterium 59_46_T64]